MKQLLRVSDLSVSFQTRNRVVNAVQGFSCAVNAGETLGIVGESGSGKSVSCLALLKLIPMPPGHIKYGSAKFDGTDLIKLNEKQLQRIRGKRISVIFQDPMTALNPYLKIGEQLTEPLLIHGHPALSIDSGKNGNISAFNTLAVELLTEVGIKDPSGCMAQYPHELSGGMRQRVMIAIALITEPDLLIADEPTTALDVTVQAQILELLRKIQQRRNIGIIFISHDLQVIRQVADTVLVMQRGKIVEQGKTSDVLSSPQREYTQKLLSAIPSSSKPKPFRFNQKVTSSPLLKIDAVSVVFPGDKQTPCIAVDSASLAINKGEVLGLVGESGCGKSTLSNAVVKLVNTSEGIILFNGHELGSFTEKQFKPVRRNIQMVFQDPYASLNPRMTVLQALAEPIKCYNPTLSRQEIQNKVVELMLEVGLEKRWINKYPHEFSGGQRQRIAIARALAVEPQLIIADEPVSALDVTIQAKILDLLLKLCKDRNLSMLFISHDLAVVRYMADRVAVMQGGRIVETGNTETLFNDPSHPYTQTLLAAGA